MPKGFQGSDKVKSKGAKHSAVKKPGPVPQGLAEAFSLRLFDHQKKFLEKRAYARGTCLNEEVRNLLDTVIEN